MESNFETFHRKGRKLLTLKYQQITSGGGGKDKCQH